MSIQLQARGRTLAALFVAVSVAACSGSTPAAQTGAPSSQAAVNTPAGASTAPVDGGGGDARYCAALKVSDAQTLIKPTVAAAQTGGPESCAFVLPGQDITGDNFTVTVFPDDADKNFYNDSVNGPASGTPNPLSGIGDVAVWEQPVAGATAPEVDAHGGSMTCIVQPPADTSTLTIAQTGSGPIYQISAAAAADYAAKEAVLCTDLFALGS